MRKFILLFIFLFSFSSYAEDWRFGVGGSLALGGTIEGDLYVSTSSGFGFGQIDLETEAGFEIEIDARYMPRNSWGFMGALAHGGSRDIDGGYVTVNGTTISATSGSSLDTIQNTYVMTNAVYRWNEFYLPFGLNFSFLKYESEGFEVDTDLGIGFQISVGYYIKDNLAVEFTSMATAFELTSRNGSGDKVDYNTSIYAYGALKAKYIF